MNVEKRIEKLEEAVAVRGEPGSDELERRRLYPDVSDEEMERIRRRHDKLFPEMAHFSDCHILHLRAQIEKIHGTGYQTCEECRRSGEAAARSREDVERLHPGGMIPVLFCGTCRIAHWYRLFMGLPERA